MQAPDIYDENSGPDLHRREICLRYGYVRSILDKLEDPYSEYYSDGMLNSEGMTLLMNLARQILQYFPELRSYFQKCYRVKTFEQVSKYLQLIREKLDNICKK